MKAAIVSAAGEKPVWGDFPAPQADEQHVVVTVKAAATRAAVSSRRWCPVLW